MITNKYRSTYYIGMTNNLGERLKQHKKNIEEGIKTFASKYNIEFLVYYEKFTWVQDAIAREKELKTWRREKKLDLIRSFNPEFEFLNDRFVNNK
ncbi:GIY-YIG nuclease family protein [Flavobacterium sp.]|uniref:GIY-YIG nuclease family protein n=1 Tax=Flavobacterium sp. TaxID=239 RepID=UPI00391D07B6